MKKRLPLFTFLVFLLFCFSIALTGNAQEIVSPNKHIKVVISAQKAPVNKSGSAVSFKVLYKKGSEYIEVMKNSPLGIFRKDQPFTDDLRLVGESKIRDVHDKYEMVCGKRKQCANVGREKVFSFRNSNEQPVDVVFRVYNDGVTFRYIFPNFSDTPVNIIGEATTYNLPDSTYRWAQPYNMAYEDFFPFSKTGVSTQKEQEWGFPALFKINNEPVYTLISEANISENNCAAKLCNLKNASAYQVIYASPRGNFNQTGVTATLPWRSQWHTIIVGELSTIVESTLITDVSEPNTLKETAWIKPGAVSWIYWAYNHGSKDYLKVVEYVDLAVEMNWPYVLIDWEWDVMGNGGNLVNAVNYAKSKGIKVLMWYNSGTAWLDATPNDRMQTAEKRAKEFSWLNEIGVSGIKVDFFAGDQQDMMKYYLEILNDAAQRHLLVNFHGATLPRGWARTWPNLMTTEAVYGAEWYNNNQVLTDKAAAHNTTLPFTRNVIGSMDYTPVTFSNSQHPHITTFAHELALSVVFESGLQHFADRPSGYQSLPAEPKEFLKHVPVSWDDTKLIDGYPGEKVIIARRKGSQWYLGGLSGQDQTRELTVRFDFADNRNYNLRLIKDGKDKGTFSSEIIKIKKGDTLKIECLPRGGFVGVLEVQK